MSNKIRIAILTFFGITILLNYYLPFDSQLVENYYSHGIFNIVRAIHDNTFGILPFSTLYLLLLVLIMGLFRYFRNNSNRKRLHITTRVKRSIIHLITLVAVVLTLFYWLWGFNYKRVSFEKRNHLEKKEVTEDWLFSQLETVHDSLVNIRSVDDYQYNYDQVEFDIRSNMNEVLPGLGYSTKGRVRVREIHPKGSLLIWSTAGVYLPFVSEGHIDAGLPILTKPFTLAHEMTHGYGEGGESTCNFVAFMVCIRSSDASIRYSGWLGYFRYLLSSCRRTNPERYALFRKEIIHEGVADDLESISAQLQKYPDILPQLRDLIYDSYLKNHGVTEGMLSYSRMIHLAKSWESKYGTYL